ncbi:hypothetical protein LOK49_LG11G02134 [Camellia lanceoleosa]|uniref:Uncharacterized protein n=1 Tax=Camellia lanceoleosa TaxID=1840588 RepID=A0ACC0FZK2_9ERIC|nr:hypothetical protein LOK49_LG11G02134 [Camellia lanceoleosa]
MAFSFSHLLLLLHLPSLPSPKSSNPTLLLAPSIPILFLSPSPKPPPPPIRPFYSAPGSLLRRNRNLSQRRSCPTPIRPKNEDEWGGSRCLGLKPGSWTVGREEPEPDAEPLTEVVGVRDPPKDEDEWGSEEDCVNSGTNDDGSALGEEARVVDDDDDKLMELKRYTAFSELLPLLAAGTTPLLKVERICQAINTNSLTIENSTILSSPFATVSFSASATFEVQTPSRIQVEFKEGTLQPPEIKPSINLPENIDIFGQKINLSPVQQSLNPLQEAVSSIARAISGQAPLKVPIPGEQSKSWLLITYLDKDLRISEGWRTVCAC